MHDTMHELRCCAYLRKSREDEEREKMGRGETLARHRRIIESLASENGHEILHWYTEVKSGETIAARTEIKNLLSDLADGKWDVVYAVEASRLGRGGGSDQEKIINAFRYTQTHLITEMKTYDPESRGDMRQLKSELRSSEDELDAISTRLVRGKYQAAKEGVWQSTGRTPYGWKAVRIKGLWQLEPDENHESMLRIYDLLESGENYSSIARILTEDGIPTPRGGDHWRHQTVKSIAENVANCGLVMYGKRHVVREFDRDTFGVVKTKRNNPEPIVSRGLHYGKGGISEERFERLTKKSVNNARLHKDKVLINPLSGLLRCGKCGYAMSMHRMSSGKSAALFYQHPRSKNMLGDCDGCRAARADQVITMLIDALEKIAEDVTIEASKPQSEADQSRIKSIQAAIKKEETARRKAMEAFEANIYTIEELRERKSKADAAIESLKKRLKDHEPKRVSADAPVKIRRCIDLLRDEGVSAQDKNDLLKSIIERIDYYNDTPPYVLPNRIRLDVHLR